METKFQTSFIPRKPLIPNTSSATPQDHSEHSGGFLVFIGMVLFGLSVASGIVVFGWQKIEASSIEKNKVQLETNKKQFGSDIEFLKRFNTKINLTKKIVESHISVAEVFDILGAVAVDNVRFSEFQFTLPLDPLQEKITFKMSGEATSFPALAYQSDIINETDKIKDPTISDLTIGEKGIIKFGLQGTIPVEKIFYKNKFIVATSTTTTNE